MSWPAGTPRYDPDATVLLPVVPADATVVLPVYQPDGSAPPGGMGQPSVPDRGPGPDEDGRSVARNSAVMAVGSIVSRLTGLLRSAVLAAALGAFAVSNSYNLANTVPNQIYELLLGGVLDSSFVPLLVRARRRDTDRGEAYAQRLLTLAMVFLGVATVLAVAAAPLISLMFSNKDTTTAGLHLTTVFSYLLLPRIFFFGAAAMIAAVLNTRDHFAAPMFAPILNNIVVIATGVLFILLPTVTHPPTPENISTPQILVLGLGTTLGMLVQTIGLLPALRKVGFRWKLRWDWRKLHLRELGRISSWMLVYVVASQVALVLVLWISNRAGSQRVDGDLAPGPTIFNNAYLIFMMANGIVAVSITTALLPRMSVAAAEHRWNDLVRNLSLGARLSSVILIPASFAFLVLGRQLGVTLFGWHDYAGKPAIQTGWVIAGAGLCLVPFAISQLQLFAFYAMPDTKTPALLNFPVAGVRIAVDLILLVVLPVVWVDAGLMVGNAISFVLSAIAGYWLLRRRIGSLNLGDVGSTLGKLAVAGLIAAVPTLLVSLILEHYLGLGKIGSVIGLVAGGLVLIVVYLAVAVALRVREIDQVWGMVRAKLGR
ncbi:murein biosynthesis integral membrane protein MurJ [Rugosimonospora africana]|uniref:Lipid II flippase MurJ n=1 Tax=Rugosimonospora africana TaxID=556532 RepID=A0A8J3R0C5_9ACTN|nr:murein biosynthesis integral membrane protein MurJ [Rugosimonospora africana]GIH17901.1 lipid II flippase MurJ [Rugosimonospora africana]